jgi:hypothetical protein
VFKEVLAIEQVEFFVIEIFWERLVVEIRDEIRAS